MIITPIQLAAIDIPTSLGRSISARYSHKILPIDSSNHTRNRRENNICKVVFELTKDKKLSQIAIQTMPLYKSVFLLNRYIIKMPAAELTQLTTPTIRVPILL